MDTKNGDLSEVLGKLMSDPQVASLVKRLKEENSQNTAEDGDAGGTALDGGAEENEDGGADGESSRKTTPSSLTDALGPLVGSIGKGSRDTENRNRLLSALKPFVNDERKEMIDKVSSISRLTSVLDAAHRGTGK